MSETLSTVLRQVSTALRIPVNVVLVVLIVGTLILLGSIIVEAIAEHRHLKVKLPELVDKIRGCGRDCDLLKEAISSSGLLKRQKAALVEILSHPDLTDNMREALAVRLLEEERNRYGRIVRISEMVSRLGPMFGLLGTLIPLGPGIMALGNGDTFTLSESMLSAFDTTVAGLASAAVATVISTIRKSWYGNYMSILEALMECVLEAQQDAG